MKEIGFSLVPAIHYSQTFCICSEPCVQASPAKQYRLLIILHPVSSYYNHSEVRVKIADQFSRAAQEVLVMPKQLEIMLVSFIQPS
ncbi:MAG: hypothetical protein CM15mP32_4240 [Flavobacteriaceae bacterium]|nr:MAG: hypothetical protein CM15mP32_4240 [Flavobacteriaceae bacterium]